MTRQQEIQLTLTTATKRGYMTKSEAFNLIILDRDSIELSQQVQYLQYVHKPTGLKTRKIKSLD